MYEMCFLPRNLVLCRLPGKVAVEGVNKLLELFGVLPEAFQLRRRHRLDVAEEGRLPTFKSSLFFWWKLAFHTMSIESCQICFHDNALLLISVWSCSRFRLLVSPSTPDVIFVTIQIAAPFSNLPYHFPALSYRPFSHLP